MRTLDYLLLKYTLTGLGRKNWIGGFNYAASASLSAKQFVIIIVILIYNILSIYVIHYVIKLIYEEN